MITRAQDRKSIQLEMDLKVNETSINDMVSTKLKKYFKKNRVDIKKRKAFECPNCSQVRATLFVSELGFKIYECKIECIYCGYITHFNNSTKRAVVFQASEWYTDVMDGKQGVVNLMDLWS